MHTSKNTRVRRRQRERKSDSQNGCSARWRRRDCCERKRSSRAWSDFGQVYPLNHDHVKVVLKDIVNSRGSWICAVNGRGTALVITIAHIAITGHPLTTLHFGWSHGRI